MIDVAETIRTAAGHAVPDTRNGTITALQRSGSIDEHRQAKRHESSGFRHVLAQTYGPIGNDQIVYQALQDELDRYIDFVDAIDRHLPYEE